MNRFRADLAASLATEACLHSFKAHLSLASSGFDYSWKPRPADVEAGTMEIDLRFRFK